MARKNTRNTRGKIVSAAWKLFYEQGYEDTTVEEIIALSQTSKGSFYHYFDGKDALLGTLSTLFDEKYEELARKALAAGNEADARVFRAKKQELAGRTEGLVVAYEGAKANADKMRQMHDKLVADIEELNARKATIKAKAAVAKTQSKVNEMTSASDRAEGARSAFDRMEAKADDMLNRANAVAELAEQPADPTEDLAKKYAEAGAAAAVDDDLARLKKEMGME